MIHHDLGAGMDPPWATGAVAVRCPIHGLLQDVESYLGKA